VQRREFLYKGTVGSVGMASNLFAKRKYYNILSDTSRNYSSRAINLIKEATTIDMLGLFADSIHERNGMNITKLWLSKAGSFTNKDFEIISGSGIKIFAFGDLFKGYDTMIEDLARWNGFIASNSRYFERIDTAEKLDSIAESGKIGRLLSYQDSTHFRTVDDVDLFYGLGQRVSQLTYNPKNRIGCGAFVDNDTGLTEFGVSIVNRMDHVGMGVDISHCGDRTTLDAISICKNPILITHAACRSLNPGYARAKTDEAIKKMAKNGGVIGIPILRFMLRNREPVTIEHFLDHIDHVVKLVGVEHVGIGSDQDLYTEDAEPLEARKKTLLSAPAKYKVHITDKYQISADGLNHPKRLFDIAEGLIRKGYSDRHIKLILGENFKRALKSILSSNDLEVNHG